MVFNLSFGRYAVECSVFDLRFKHSRNGVETNKMGVFIPSGLCLSNKEHEHSTKQKTLQRPEVNDLRKPPSSLVFALFDEVQRVPSRSRSLSVCQPLRCLRGHVSPV